MSVINYEQMKASDPFNSVWVSASAGTGKTKVLTDRVLRLLLQVTKPEKILCLTFTKAAAAEMKNRINSVLQKWATCSIKSLQNEIELLTQETIDEEILKRARSLFSKTLDVPGGMKIMTIHSFCESVLKRFPLEANVPPHFEVLDDLSAQSMKEQILADVLAANDLNETLKNLASLISTNSLNDLFDRLLAETPKLLKLLESYPGGIESVIFSIKQYFNINNYLYEKQIINEYFQEDEWPEKKQFYLTNAGTIRVARKEDSHALEAWETNERLKAFQVTQATEILLKIAFRVVEKYNALKNQNALLDYTDLIEKTKTLLLNSDMTAWVLYKLDGGLDHILVDEAQDTNFSQWTIVKALAEEFFSGEDASDQLRTLFVVGDKKQSIFSFQGANPLDFERMHQFFEKRILDTQNGFYNIPLNYSFRSTEPVLRLVNYLLKNNHAKDGVLFDKETADHLANRSQDAGLVEIWPVEEVQKTDAPDPWKPPIERQENDSAMKRLIDKMADKIEQLIGHEYLPSQNRKVEPWDILILLQKRSAMMGQIVRTLHQRNIPVAGVDRLMLSDHLAIQDLLALTEFVLQPQNDLNLANLIKSSLLGLTEDDLYHVCYQRGQKTVWQQIQKLYPEKSKILSQIMALSDKTPPFEFFSTLLGVLGGRKKFIARFGKEVNEALDEFLNLTLEFEKNNTPSLQVFLNWFSSHEIEIKRDLDNSGINAVRIMTVHGSKGLQGNIVFLPDTRSTRTKNVVGGEFIWLDEQLPLWIPNVQLRPAKLDAFFEQQQHLAQQEKRRLLYVALTRACDRLYVCGYGKGGADNWYDLIMNSLPQEIQPDENGIIKWESQQQHEVEAKTKEMLPYDRDKLPEWTQKDAREEKPEPRPISPSKIDDSDGDSMPEESILSQEQSLALKRGTFLHQLLQFLPTIPSEHRLEVAQKMCPADIELPPNLLEIFEREDLKDLFGENSMAEVPVVGKINGEMISGQVDRLVVLPNEVKIIDFKTNRFVPTKVPDVYKKQLNTYKDLLKEIFPDRIVKSYILWTQTLYFEEVI